MIHKISFKNYKLFKARQELELKPITILIGKNSSGKSAITKLPTLIENSLTGNFKEPINLQNKGIELGGEFIDLVYGRTRIGKLEIAIEDKPEILEVIIGSGIRTKDLPEFDVWKYKNEEKEFEANVDKDDFNGFLCKNIRFKNLTLNTDYIGPFREFPRREGYNRTHQNYADSIGIDGKDAYPILVEDSITTDQALLKKINNFYQKNFEGWGIKVNENDAPNYKIEIFRERISINIKDVGQGISQTLPLVVRAFMPCKKETLIIIEQPELHLHPAAHGNLAQLFVESLFIDDNKTLDSKKFYLIETHSPNFVLRIRRLIAEGKLSCKDVVIYYIDFDEEKNESNLRKIEIDNKGRPNFWPRAIFNESLDETIAIRDAQLLEEEK